MSNLPSNLEAIRACGYQHVMVSTDGGQVNNPLWEEALRQYVDIWLKMESQKMKYAI